MVIASAALPRRFAGLGVLLLGFSWSLGIFLARQDVVEASGLPPATAFAYVAAGGVGSVAAAWLGIGAVLYAMTRLFRARAPFWAVLWALAGAFPPLWIGAPAAASISSGGEDGLAALVVVAAVIAFLALATSTVADVAALSRGRAAATLVLTAIFCLSVVSLS